MQPTSGRLVFKMGDAFPADNPVAVFLTSMSTALNDLLTTTKWILGGDTEQPNRRQVTDVEQQYLLRLSFAQLFEVRESIKHARRDEEVDAFLKGLPDPAVRDLERLMKVNTPQDDWLLKAMTYVRNQTNHYGGKWNWDDVRWAMKQVADEDGEIEMVNDKLAGMRLKFADLIAIQHMTRKFPEYVIDPDADLDQGTIEARLSTLFKAIADVTAAAQNFATAVVDAYLDTLPEDVVRAEA